MKQLTTLDFSNLIGNVDTKNFKPQQPCILDFYADWCQPCKALKHILQQIENEQPEIIIYQIDAEEEFELAAHFKVRNLPTLILINTNGETKSVSGVITKNKLQDMISQNFKLQEV
jgi:thioredoxin